MLSGRSGKPTRAREPCLVFSVKFDESWVKGCGAEREVYASGQQEHGLSCGMTLGWRGGGAAP
jgi:hypothetical protein